MQEADVLALSSLIMAASGACAAGALLSGITAPYGRYAEQHVSLARAYSCGLPLLPARLAWLLQECPSFLTALYMVVARGMALPSALATPRGFLAALFLAHYFNRGFIYPLRITGGKPTPLGICAMAFAFCLWNGANMGAYLSADAPPGEPAELLQPRFLCGALLFFAGMGINLEADHILRTLRAPGETGYKVPMGGAFSWVSGANFFGECLEWAGFALAAYRPTSGLTLPLLSTLNSIPGLHLLLCPPVAFALFTWLNIGPRALQHHANYQKMFRGAYPKDRKALIPGIL
jgi:3-oxo-5-alpha-steroid 4-dehydrogenase 1